MLLLVGRSATGKTEIVKELVNNYQMEKLVTYTSRTMRPGEVDGRDYHFLNPDEFLKRIKDNFFLEYVCYNNNYYGTAYCDISFNKVVILEPNGLKVYQEKLKDEVTIVYLKCDLSVLKSRMLNRLDKLDDIEKRLILDNKVFNKEVESLADLVIDTTSSNIQDVSSKIYQFYLRKVGKVNE